LSPCFNVEGLVTLKIDFCEDLVVGIHLEEYIFGGLLFLVTPKLER
jgi:hypothetical protein